MIGQSDAIGSWDDPADRGARGKRLLFGLSAAAIDWVSLAKGMGVPGARVETAEDLTQELARARSESGPRLIEAIM
jgi:acetolactate synthase-1/2/3 large subunit